MPEGTLERGEHPGKEAQYGQLGLLTGLKREGEIDVAGETEKRHSP